MEERKVITEEMKQALLAPLPAEAISQHPSKPFLSTIKAIYVTERLNDVFGVGTWQIQTQFVAQQERMIVVKATLTINDYGVYYESYGGNDNADLGDAYKGATTDAITKIGSYLGIGIDVFKGKANASQPKQENKPAATNNKVDYKKLNQGQMKDKVRDYCSTNADAEQYYFKKYGINDLKYLKLDQAEEAYNELIKFKKIVA